uniref:Uncharacterized protein n=1 Tax=Lepeophtheirus salmonis TaxID=72036 RepID=A0A0K2TRG4_LEPSM
MKFCLGEFLNRSQLFRTSRDRHSKKVEKQTALLYTCKHEIRRNKYSYYFTNILKDVAIFMSHFLLLTLFTYNHHPGYIHTHINKQKNNHLSY